MTSFYLIRHGQKEAIPFDPPLTAIGIKQAEVTADCLKDVSFKVVFVSSKLRAKQTAEIIAKPHSLPISLDDRLIERLEWENSESFDEFIVEWAKTDNNRSYQPTIGDSSINKGKKMKEVIEELAAKYEEGNVLVVTHGGAIGDLLRNLFSEENIRHEIDPVTGAPHIQISECSITIVQKDTHGYKLDKLNDISHLSIPLI